MLVKATGTKVAIKHTGNPEYVSVGSVGAGKEGSPCMAGQAASHSASPFSLCHKSLLCI